MRDSLFSNVRYLAINDQDEKWGVSITTVGFQSIRPHAAYPPKGHPSAYNFNPSAGRVLQEYQLIYITKGSGSFQSEDGRHLELNAGMLLMLFPHEWHTYQPHPRVGWDTYWVGCKGSYADTLIRNHFFSRKNHVFDIGFNEKIVALFEELMDIAKMEKTGFQQAISGITINLLGLVYYISRNHSFGDREVVAKIEKARTLMREQAEKKRSLEEIAFQLNMSYSWFRRMFKQYTGMSPAQYQQQIRLQRAKDLLACSGKTISEIAFLLDFESPGYFSVSFKHQTGMTPKEYRAFHLRRIPPQDHLKARNAR